MALWDNSNEKYYISIIDIVRILSESDNPRDYWYHVKKRMSSIISNTNKHNYEYVDIKKIEE